MSDPHRWPRQHESSSSGSSAPADVVVPDSFERLAEYLAPKVRISTRFAILYPLSTRRYAVQEDAIVFASGLDEANIVRWLMQRVGITTGRGASRYVIVLDLHRQFAWRAAYSQAVEFLHAANPLDP